jgi:magnesium transporter
MKHLPFVIPRIRKTQRHRTSPGAVPGTLPEPGASTASAPEVVDRRLTSDATHLEMVDVPREALPAALEKPDPLVVTWLDVHGVHDSELLRTFGDLLGLHALTQEDIAHVHQRPKIELFEDYVFITVRAIRMLDNQEIDNEQISFVLKGNLLVSFQERPGDGFHPVRARLNESAGVIRSRPAEYLFYALLDTIIDNYFPVLERFGESMELLEDRIRAKPSPGLSGMVHTLRRVLRMLHRAIWPLREDSRQLSAGEVPSFTATIRTSFRDCTDHVMQVAEFVESARERASDLGDLYNALVSERTNQVMKTLTIVSTIFIPLTFLCGLYGMNFNPASSPWNMPELNWPYAYPVLLAVMVALAAGMLGLFFAKGWLGNQDK